MKKFSNKSALLFAATMALCAFAMPSMASAASWSGSTHQRLDSVNIGFTTAIVNSSCASSTFTARIDNGATLTITTGSFTRCFSTSSTIGRCTTTSQGTGFPWIATAINSTNIQIHGVDIDVRFEHESAATQDCAVNGLTSTLEGTVTGATYSNATNTLTFDNSPGLTSTSALGNSAALAIGSVRSTDGLVVLP